MQLLLTQRIRNEPTICPETLAGFRDKALLLIGFSGAFRRSELVALNIEDLTTSEEGLVLLMREGKTDQKRKGRKVAIPFGKDPLCSKGTVTSVPCLMGFAMVN